MFRARQATAEDRQRVHAAFFNLQTTLDQTKGIMDSPTFPDEALIGGCDRAIGDQLDRFYNELSKTHGTLTEVCFGFRPIETEPVDGYPL